MLSFRTFLFEAPWLNHDLSYMQHEKDDPDTVTSRRLSGQLDTHMGTMDSGHDIYHGDYQMHDGTPKRMYAAKLDDKLHVLVAGKKVQNDGVDEFHVTSLQSYKGSTIKAHDFYHHLITDHGVNLVSDREHSPGGSHVWNKLSQMPGVRVSHRDSATGWSERPLEKNWNAHYGNNGKPDHFGRTGQPDYRYNSVFVARAR